MSVRISAAFLGAVALAWVPTAGAFAADCANGKHIPANDPACATTCATPGDANNLVVRKAGEKPVEYLKAPEAKSGTGSTPNGRAANTGTVNASGGAVNGLSVSPGTTPNSGAGNASGGAINNGSGATITNNGTITDKR